MPFKEAPASKEFSSNSYNRKSCWRKLIMEQWFITQLQQTQNINVVGQIPVEGAAFLSRQKDNRGKYKLFQLKANGLIIF